MVLIQLANSCRRCLLRGWVVCNSSRSGAVVRRADCQRHRGRRTDGRSALLRRRSRQIQGMSPVRSEQHHHSLNTRYYDVLLLLLLLMPLSHGVRNAFRLSERFVVILCGFYRA